MTDGARLSGSRQVRDAEIVAKLSDEVPQMTELVRHNRTHAEAVELTPRKLLTTLQVEVWEEADGSESIVIHGSLAGGKVEANGLLHDALWALVHSSRPA